MNTAIINVKTDPETKRRLKEFAAEVGIPVSALINAQVKQMLRDGQVVVGTTLTPTPYLKKLIREAEADYAAGKNITRVRNKDKLEKYLNSV